MADPIALTPLTCSPPVVLCLLATLTPFAVLSMLTTLTTLTTLTILTILTILTLRTPLTLLTASRLQERLRKTEAVANGVKKGTSEKTATVTPPRERKVLTLLTSHSNHIAIT